MRTPAADCLMIEGSTAGVRAAIAVGMRVFGFFVGRHCDVAHREHLLAAGAEQVIGSFDELDVLILAAFCFLSSATAVRLQAGTDNGHVTTLAFTAPAKCICDHNR